jgi:hypothetical protein
MARLFHIAERHSDEIDAAVRTDGAVEWKAQVGNPDPGADGDGGAGCVNGGA